MRTACCGKIDQIPCGPDVWRRRFQGLHGKMGDLWWYAALLFIAHRFGDLINLYIGYFYVPRILPGEQLGAVLPLMQAGTFFAIPLALVLMPMKKFLNVFATRGEHGKARRLLTDVLGVTVLVSVLIALYIYFSADFLLLRMRIDDRRVIALLIGFAVVGSAAPVLQNAASALRMFKLHVFSSVIGPLVRLTGMLLLLGALGVAGYLTAQLATQMSVLMLLAWGLWRYLRRFPRGESYLRSEGRAIWRYLWPLAFLTVASRLRGFVEPFAVRHWLSLEDSAGYYVVFMFGNLATYVSAALVPFLFTLISERHERGQRTDRLLLQSVVFTVLTGFAVALLLALFGRGALQFSATLAGYADYAPFFWRMAVIQTMRTALICLQSHEHACRRFTYLRVLVPCFILEAALLYCVGGWSFFRPHLPLTVWQWVDTRVTFNLGFVLTVLFWSQLIVLVSTIARVIGRHKASTVEGD